MKNSSNPDKVKINPKFTKTDSNFDHDKIIKELDLTNNFPTGYIMLYR